MNITQRMRKIQAGVFQDKEVLHFLPVPVEGELSRTTRHAPEASGSYRVNFQTVTDALTAQEYGLTLNRDALMRSSFPPPVEVGHYVAYGGGVYRVTAVHQNDAYTQYALKAVD